MAKFKVPEGALKLPRSSEWPALREAWLRDHPSCANCGCTKNLQVHHKIPVHVQRSLELDPSNLITLCEHADGKDLDTHCHFVVGHHSNWFAFNRSVESDAARHLQAKYVHVLQQHKASPMQADGATSAVDVLPVVAPGVGPAIPAKGSNVGASEDVVQEFQRVRRRR